MEEVNTHKIWANAMKNTPIEHGQVTPGARSARRAERTNKNLRKFRVLYRLRLGKLFESADIGLFDRILDHRPAKTDEGNSCHYSDKGHPSKEQA